MSGTESRSPPFEKEVGLDEEAVGIVDKLEAPVKVKRILPRGQDDPLEQVRRPWYRVKRRECLEKILVLARKNYKVFADIGPTVGLMSRVLSVLDTGAGPNLIRKSELPQGLETLVSFGPTQDIGDANNRPLRTVGTIRMPVRLGLFVATAEFVVCEKLAVPLILGADYCDRFVEAIYPRKKTVELADFSEVPIIRWFSARKMRKALVPGEDETEGKGERISPRVKVARPTTIEPGTQRVVECTSKRAGLVVVQRYSPLYEKHGLTCTNGVVQVEPDRPFCLLIAIFREYPLRVQKGQVVAELLPRREPCSRAKPPSVKCSGFKKRQGKKFLNLPSRLRASQDCHRQIKRARNSQKNGRVCSLRRHHRSWSSGLSPHRRTWRTST